MERFAADEDLKGRRDRQGLFSLTSYEESGEGSVSFLPHFAAPTRISHLESLRLSLG